VTYQPREWRFRHLPVPADRLASLHGQTGLDPLTLELCLSRGLDDAGRISEFLAPRLDRLTSVLNVAGLRQAVTRIADARQDSSLVWVFGDYDVDGTSGAALLSWFFREIGVRHEVRQPDRFKDGYGLNVRAVDEAHTAGARLLVTVDCGISSFAAAERARELGVDLVIVDHHQLDQVRGLPPAYAVINPQRPDCSSGLKQLCGCGLAFFLCVGLRAEGRERGWWQPGQEPNLKQHLDLVVMATAADLVPLTGDNHVLVRHGMQVLKESRKPGVKALLQAAGVGDRELSPGHLGFVLGPRINASGRLGSASTALELLTTEDPARAQELARQLESVNAERAEIQNRIWDEVKVRVEEGIAQGRYQHGVVVADPGWHEGVVGIVASRVVEAFRRPAIILSIREDHAKGSARTFAGKDVLEALRRSASHLKAFGGHAHAAGVTVELSQVDAFAQRFDEVLAEIPEDTEKRVLWVEREVSMASLTTKTLGELENLGPFGPGNPEPVFSMKALIRGHRILKDRHLKLTLERDGQRTDAIWFNAAEHLPWLLATQQAGEPLWEWAGVPELNRFRGSVTPTFRIRDVRRLTDPVQHS
jgi:single-stranded-DNA-specific exonuclease